ncbi:Telomere repeat-binding factor 5 [Linum perenne]
MGNHKQMWTKEEEDALLAGISRYGLGNWKIIRRDPDFAPSFSHRSNIDLKVSTTMMRSGNSMFAPVARSTSTSRDWNAISLTNNDRGEYSKMAKERG